MRKSIVFLIISIIIVISLTLTMFVNSLRNDDYLFEDPRPVPQVEIRFVSSWNRYEGLKKILEKFQAENPKIRLIDDSTAGEGFLEKIKNDFYSGNHPDIFALWPGSDINKLIEKGKVAPLNSYIESNDSLNQAFSTGELNIFKQAAQIFSIPLEIICEGLFINNELFERYNIKIPQTYKELLTAVREFREQGIIPIAYNSTPEGSFIYQNIIMKLGGADAVIQPVRDGKIHPSFLEAMYIMRELYENGAFPENVFDLDDVARDNLFLNQKAAMIVQGSWFIYFISDKDNFKLSPFPSFDDTAAGNSIIYGVGSGNFHISSNAWHNPAKQEAALLLLDALVSEESVKILSEKTGFISSTSTQSPDNKEPKSKHRLQVDNLIRNAVEKIPPVDHYMNRKIWEEKIIPAFPGMLAKKISPEKIFNDIKWDDL